MRHRIPMFPPNRSNLYSQHFWADLLKKYKIKLAVLSTMTDISVYKLRKYMNAEINMTQDDANRIAMAICFYLPDTTEDEKMDITKKLKPHWFKDKN